VIGEYIFMKIGQPKLSERVKEVGWWFNLLLSPPMYFRKLMISFAFGKLYY